MTIFNDHQKNHKNKEKKKKNQVYGKVEDNFRMFTVCSTYPQSNGI